MDQADSQLKLTLKAWPEPDPASSSIASLIPRLQAQRGHFRDTTVAILQEEIARQNESKATYQGEDMYDIIMGEGGNIEKTTEDESATADQERREKLARGREEVIANIGMAHHEAMLALDFISLIVSLHSPEAGFKTMSQSLKELVPTRSLGVEKINAKYPPNAVADDKLVSKGWKTESLDTAGNSLMAAATRLKNECTKERNYWEDVISIREDGWNISRLPREKHTLGVRYGFAESAPEYNEKGVGALRIGEDGRVIVQDVYITGATRKAVRVHIAKDGIVIGQSKPYAMPLGSSIRDRIEAARNFIYEDELFFEILREARLMANHGIKTSRDSVTLDLENGKCVIIDTVPIDEDPFIGTNSRDDNAAQAVLMGLRLLLSHGHRGILKRRSRPQPPISNIKRSPPPLPLLRPTATHLLHQEHLQGLTKHLKWIEDICRSAGLATEVKIIPLKNCFRKNLKDIESTVEAFTGVLETEAIIQLPGGWKVTILMRTLLAAPFFGTCYVATASHDGVAAKLMGRNSFPSYKELEFYLLWCLERSVVNAIRLMEGLGWEQQGQGNTIQKHEVKRLKQAAVQATPKGLTLRWGFAGGRDSVLLFDGGEMDRDLATVLREI